MFCENCGAQNSDNPKFCATCGAKQEVLVSMPSVKQPVQHKIDQTDAFTQQAPKKQNAAEGKDFQRFARKNKINDDISNEDLTMLLLMKTNQSVREIRDLMVFIWILGALVLVIYIILCFTVFNKASTISSDILNRYN
jgi:hypothetical protein